MGGTSTAATPGTGARARFTAVHGEIRERICLLRYPPGYRLSEEALAAEFGVSRTPIRRVLNRLEFEGLVESRHGAGTFVTTVDFEALTDVYALRMRLAELIGELSPRPRTAEDLAAIRAILTRCRALGSAPDPVEFARLNMAFALELARCTANRALRETSERLYFQTARIWLEMVPQMDWDDEVDVFAREVEAIIEAMELGDIRAVGLIRRNHISLSLIRLTRYLEDRTVAA